MTQYPFKTIALAADHAGFSLKNKVKDYLSQQKCNVVDLGTNDDVSVDYPDFGYAIGKAISTGQADAGLVICGSGIGISIAANRYKKVRAALCHNSDEARLARQHNDANVLALGARTLDEDTAFACIKAFFETSFEGGRHARRVEKLGQKGE